MSPPRIVFYSSTACPLCAAVRAALDASGYPYEERDPLSDVEYIRDLLRSTASPVVPTLIVNGVAFVGYDAELLEEVLRDPPPDLPLYDEYTTEELSDADDFRDVDGESG
jgi:glutaredoxin